MKGVATLHALEPELSESERTRVNALCYWIERTLREEQERTVIRIWLALNDPLNDFIDRYSSGRVICK